ncbi:DUF3830 family protein [Ensifer sp. ENS05]|uniref:DUF3830 family protein n=1 Tax=Ensifer sp. ENS05 TaxID=2769277 RepID=UPI00177AFE21|nr:DUF3830 family protein [Ensifer sp. ENS05]MBD9597384.1 DUF3830 family protein [Ensifer sp. ENS05]
MKYVRIEEPKSGLVAHAALLDEKAPENARFLWEYLATPRVVSGIHAMWTGPEISCPVPYVDISATELAAALPLENATLTPQAGDIVMSYVPQRVWGGNPDPIFDIGLFYGVGARLFFPIGWLPGSVTAQVIVDEREGLAKACAAIRRNGACEITFSRGERP